MLKALIDQGKETAKKLDESTEQNKKNNADLRNDMKQNNRKLDNVDKKLDRMDQKLNQTAASLRTDINKTNKRIDGIEIITNRIPELETVVENVQIQVSGNTQKIAEQQEIIVDHSKQLINLNHQIIQAVNHSDQQIAVCDKNIKEVHLQTKANSSEIQKVKKDVIDLTTKESTELEILRQDINSLRVNTSSIPTVITGMPNSSKLFDMAMENIKIFNDDPNCNYHVCEFLEDLSAFAPSVNSDWNILVRIIKGKIGPQVKPWFTSVQNQISTFDEFKNVFLHRFWSRERQSKLRRIITGPGYLRSSGLSISKYITILYNFSQFLTDKIDEETSCDNLTHHLPERYQLHFVGKYPTTFIEMENQICQMENITNSSNKANELAIFGTIPNKEKAENFQGSRYFPPHLLNSKPKLNYNFNGHPNFSNNNGNRPQGFFNRNGQNNGNFNGAPYPNPMGPQPYNGPSNRPPPLYQQQNGRQGFQNRNVQFERSAPTPFNSNSRPFRQPNAGGPTNQNGGSNKAVFNVNRQFTNTNQNNSNNKNGKGKFGNGNKKQEQSNQSQQQ